MIIKNKISIIGGGAVGVSLLYQLVKKNTSNYCVPNLEINIFEKSSRVGPGLAYNEDNDVNLLNRPAETMSAVYGNPNDFMQWLTNNKEWKKIYPNVQLDKNRNLFLPRSLFGRYLECLFEDTLAIARNNNIKINIIRDEVVDLQKIENVYLLTTKNGTNYLSHSVVLALGYTPSKHYDHLKVTNKYYESPYPTTEISNCINKNASVAIIGSRLSAIDAAMSLYENGHQGQIAFISRYGYMPSVRPNGIFDHKLKLITTKKLNELTNEGVKNLSLKKIEEMLVEEVSLATGKIKNINEWLDRPKDAVLYLKRELLNTNCQDYIIWQSIMIAMNGIIELIWHKLSERDKKIFIKKYRSRWMAYRVGIPYQNAEKILSLMEQGQLLSISGLKNIEYDKKIEKFIINVGSNSSIRTFDYAINATGSCSDIDTTKSSLLMNMKKNGYC